MKLTFRKLTSLIVLALATSLSFAQLNNPDHWKFFQSPEKVNTIFENGNELWFATKYGLVILNKETQEQTYYNTSNSALPSEDIKGVARIGETDFIGTYDLILLQENDGDWTAIDIPIDESELLVNQVPVLYSMKADHNGNLWFGTNYGAVKYDGEEFEIFHRNNTPQLDETFRDVWVIDVDEEGSVYFSSHEIYKYKDGVFTNIVEGNTELFAYSDPLLTYGGGKLWFSNFINNIAWYDQEVWHFLDPEQMPNETLSDMQIDGDGNPFFLFKFSGIYTIENDQMVATDFMEGHHSNLDKIFFDQDHVLWASDNATYYSETNDGISSNILGDIPFQNNITQIITEDKNGKIYTVNNHKYILTYDYVDGWNKLEIPASLVFNNITSIDFDSQNELWASTSTGVLHFDGTEWDLLNSGTNPDVPFLSTFKLCIDHNDRKWIASYGKLGILDGDTWSIFDNNDIPWDEYISAMTLDQYSNLLLGDNVGNLFRVNSIGNYTQINTDDILYNQNSKINTIYYDKDDKLWVILNYNDGHQVFYMENNQWVEFEDTSSDVYYNGYIVEDDHAMYLGLSKSILKWNEDETIEYISNENSLLRTANNAVNVLFMDKQNSLWNISNGLVINVYNENGFETFTGLTDHLDNDLNLQIFPNPVNSLMKVEGTHPSFLVNEKLTLNVINVLGQNIQSYQIDIVENGKFQHDLNVENFPNGIYHLHLKGIGTQKFIIQR